MYAKLLNNLEVLKLEKMHSYTYIFRHCCKRRGKRTGCATPSYRERNNSQR